MENIKKAIASLSRAARDNEAPTGCEELACEAALEFVDLCDEMIKATKIMRDYQRTQSLLKKQTDALFQIKNMKAKFIGGKTTRAGMAMRMREIASTALGSSK